MRTESHFTYPIQLTRRKVFRSTKPSVGHYSRIQFDESSETHKKKQHITKPCRNSTNSEHHISIVIFLVVGLKCIMFVGDNLWNETFDRPVQDVTCS